MGFSSLEILDFSYNNFEGSIPPSIGNLSTLKAFSVAHNLLEGSLPSGLCELKRLQELDLSQNHSGGTIPPIGTGSPPGWFPSFQLKVLALSNCSLNSHTNVVPSFLRHQFDLRIVELCESFPGWLLENNTNLATLLLRNNSFFGEFQLPPFVLINTVMVDVSSNRIHGLPMNIGKIVPHLEYLDLSRNAFDQDLLPSIGDMRNLQVLDLSYNNFSGEIPEELIAGCGDLRVLILSEGRLLGRLYLLDIGYNFMMGNIGSWIGNVTYLDILVMRNNYLEGRFECEAVSRSLYYLDLSHNHFSGPLPICSRLQYLHLQGNRFNGSISDAFLNTSQLLVLNLKDNDLSGNVPDMIGSLSSLRVLLLSQNRLTGLIPEELCRLKQISMMDLSINSFFGYGTLKKEYKLHSTAEQSVTLVEVDFLTKHRSSTYKGSILSFMSGLDLSCNNLSGRIPNVIGNLCWIHTLNLSYNMFTGPIPKSFSNLTQIKSLDLSHNALSGEIPSSLINLYFLEVFSVVCNNLSSRIPDSKAQFGTFDRSCYEGNRFLCGQPLNQNCSTESPHPSDKIRGSKYGEMKSNTTGSPLRFRVHFDFGCTNLVVTMLISRDDLSIAAITHIETNLFL
ncbi:hypothetical protein F3Y22_tig00110847pilonHSYRG00044 [Hibiscus syriacus]|uniref:Uncharacterized protein n=1 Tax=Hibiscus syriacus TaxID=106335 RepID=A0A6A2ZM63_HIBSY|nr:hypothetical protein F3Y22_tig00110847pilonHSYRG00044 [Hibiscus syriacus]